MIEFMKILIVEDHFLFRKSLKLMLSEICPEAILLEADNYKNTLLLLNASEIELVMLDIDIPGGIGTAMVGQIKELAPSARILICSGADEEENALHYITAGADGYLSKSANETEAITAVSKVLSSKKYVSDTVQAQLLEVITTKNIAVASPSGSKRLSERENQIMDLLLAGKWVKEVAETLNLRANTVSTVKGRILEKMGVSNLLELAKKMKK
jgi:two-component system invasion response regulator UvrY